MTKNEQKLVADIANKCIEHGITFRLEYTDIIDQDSIPCSGYFDEKSLVVAVKKPKTIDWLDVLVHESCHVDQFIEKAKVWVPDEKSLFVVEKWIEGKSLSKTKLHEGFYNTVALEIDCEKRTIKKLRKYKIAFNESLYIQKANAYLFSYGYALLNKKWYKKPYEKIFICKKMPKVFLTPREYLDPSSKYLQYFK